MGQNGGRRPGAGRKPGGLTLKTREIREQAVAEGITPLEVMLKNMRHYDQAQEAMSAHLTKMLPEVSAMDNPELFTEFVKLVGKVLAFREKAQECAVDAAPYIHPRFASIQFTPPPADGPMDMVGDAKNLKDAVSYYAQTLDAVRVPAPAGK